MWMLPNYLLGVVPSERAPVPHAARSSLYLAFHHRAVTPPDPPPPNPLAAPEPPGSPQRGGRGCSLLAHPPTGADDPPIPVSTRAVRITRVVEGTAADRGGIEVGDVVVAMEGKPLTLERLGGVDRTPRSVGLVVDGFSRRIAAHRPGDRLTITLYRGRTRRDVEVRLGRWSRELRGQGTVVAINEALVVARDRFHGWWSRHFHTPPAAD